MSFNCYMSLFSKSTSQEPYLTIEKLGLDLDIILSTYLTGDILYITNILAIKTTRENELHTIVKSNEKVLDL